MGLCRCRKNRFLIQSRHKFAQGYLNRPLWELGHHLQILKGKHRQKTSGELYIHSSCSCPVLFNLVVTVQPNTQPSANDEQKNGNLSGSKSHPDNKADQQAKDDEKIGKSPLMHFQVSAACKAENKGNAIGEERTPNEEETDEEAEDQQ